MIQPSEYFLSALEAQRSINAHIHEIEPTTPVVLYEIDLNEIKPSTINYPTTNANGPLTSGVLRLHNDFNLFNINRGIIEWKNYYYIPFPIFGEQFDITSNGTIPTPKLKFSSQYLDDEYNSFYKYIRMQINELKDIVGAKVTRRKTFVRYLHPDNFAGRVNPFNEFSQTPWASREGDTLTVRSNYPVPPPNNMAKWLIYYPKPNYGTKGKVFASLKDESKSKLLNSVYSQQYNYTVESEDYFSLLINQNIETDQDLSNGGAFNVDAFVISGGSNFTQIIPDDNLEFTSYESSNKIKLLCNHTSNLSASNIFNTGEIFTYNINYPVNFNENPEQLVTFVSLKSNTEHKGTNTFTLLGDVSGNANNRYENVQTTSGFSVSFKDSSLKTPNYLEGTYNINYLTLTTGYYTGVNPYSNEITRLAALRIMPNWSGFTGKSLDINFPFEFSSMPKILLQAWGNSGNLYNHYISNITATGLTLNAQITGFGYTSGMQYHLGMQNFHILATDYLCDDLNATGASQIFSSNANLALEYKQVLDKKSISTYEVELTPDVFYIDRKIQEDSNNISYELASLLDVEGVKLPSRTLLSKNCPFVYRGEGCVYEYDERLTIAHSGVYGEVMMDVVPGGDGNIANKSLALSQRCRGLRSAPPVADDSDMPFTEAINQLNWTDRGKWGNDINYFKNNYTFIEKNEIKYYFVCTQNHISNAINAPPNTGFWKSDACSKTLKGCRLRWRENPNFPNITIKATFDTTSNADINGNVIPVEDIIYQYDVKAPIDANGKQLIGLMPFGGFPSVEGKYQTQQGPQS